MPEDLASVEDVKRYEEIKCHDALHSASVPGITALDLQVFFKVFLSVKVKGAFPLSLRALILTMTG